MLLRVGQAILYVLCFFAVVFPYIFLTVKLWTDQGTFGTVVYTVVVGISGLFANSRHKYVPPA